MSKKLTIVELTNPEQLFGSNLTPYAMFSATCEGNSIEIGITHNSLSRKGYDTDASALNRLVGCTIVTKDFVDSRTGEIVNGDERVDMVLNGEGRLVLFNSVNHSIVASDIYKQEQLELLATAKAKVTIEKQREILNAKRMAKLAQLASRVPDAPTERKLEENDETIETEQTVDAELTFDNE